MNPRWMNLFFFVWCFKAFTMTFLNQRSDTCSRFWLCRLPTFSWPSKLIRSPCSDAICDAFHVAIKAMHDDWASYLMSISNAGCGEWGISNCMCILKVTKDTQDPWLQTSELKFHTFKSSKGSSLQLEVSSSGLSGCVSSAVLNTIGFLRWGL